MRNITVAAGSLIVLMMALFAGFHSYTLQKSIVVNAPIFDVSPQLTNLANWKNWNDAFSGNTGIEIKLSSTNNSKMQQFSLKENNYKLTVLNAAAIVVERKKNGTTTSEYISAVPDSNGRVTNVFWSKNIKGYVWLKNKIFDDEDISGDLENLKLFLEDESKRYGYRIKIEPVIDTLILTKKMIATSGHEIEIIGLLYSQLQQYIKTNNIPTVKNYHYVSSTRAENKRTNIAVGIPVNKEAAKQIGYEFLKLPKQGRLLIGKYTGAYNEINKLYAAMDKYIMNNHLKKVAQYLEQHQNDEVDFKDNSNVTMEVAYPIY